MFRIWPYLSPDVQTPEYVAYDKLSYVPYSPLVYDIMDYPILMKWNIPWSGPVHNTLLRSILQVLSSCWGYWRICIEVISVQKEKEKRNCIEGVWIPMVKVKVGLEFLQFAREWDHWEAPSFCIPPSWPSSLHSLLQHSFILACLMMAASSAFSVHLLECNLLEIRLH
jgi:hypothetical protein